MRTFVTALLALVAFVTGVVVTGYLGDQGRSLDVLPFLVGALFALAVVALRLRGGHRGRA